MSFLLHPSILPWLLLDLAVGCIVSACSRWVIGRLLVWFVFPLAVAIAVAGPHTLFAETGESQGWAMLVFIYLAPSGFVACGAGVLLGYFLRRVIATKSVLTHDT